jgi:hypothetical protein
MGGTDGERRADDLARRLPLRDRSSIVMRRPIGLSPGQYFDAVISSTIATRDASRRARSSKNRPATSPTLIALK